MCADETESRKMDNEIYVVVGFDSSLGHIKQICGVFSEKNVASKIADEFNRKSDEHISLIPVYFRRFREAMDNMISDSGTTWENLPYEKKRQIDDRAVVMAGISPDKHIADFMVISVELDKIGYWND